MCSNHGILPVMKRVVNRITDIFSLATKSKKFDKEKIIFLVSANDMEVIINIMNKI